MNYFLDENFPKGAVNIFSDDDKIYDIRGSSKEGINDVEIFNLAKQNEATFITTDKDFFHTIHVKQKPHFGIVVIALSQPDSASILEKLEWFLKSFNQTSLNNKCFLIQKNSCKVFQ